MSGTPKARSGVYETYWYFAAERQNIFYRRLHQEPTPYSPDPIFQTYKFCNTYRASDRVSQFLIRDVIYRENHAPLDTLFRIFLFRLLNRPQSWVALEEKVGPVSLKTFSVPEYTAALASIKEEGALYGNAFILCANKAFGYNEKHRNHLALLEHVFCTSDCAKQLVQATTLRELFTLLRGLPLIGDFMAYQLAIDFNYSEVFTFDENDFTIAGPGALRGIAKCFESTDGMGSDEVIQWMVEHQDNEFERLGLTFQDLGGRKLHAIDCQGLFCETDKYCRVKFPELASNRVRIKARFEENRTPVDYFYPPKWGITLPEHASQTE